MNRLGAIEYYQRHLKRGIITMETILERAVAIVTVAFYEIEKEEGLILITEQIREEMYIDIGESLVITRNSEGQKISNDKCYTFEEFKGCSRSLITDNTDELIEIAKQKIKEYLLKLNIVIRKRSNE
jgi:hypothetical protein